MTLLLILFISVSDAQSIQKLIQYSIKKHHSLKSIKHQLSVMDERIALSQQWENPDLSFTINDIQFRKPLSREEERMQYQSLNFKQKFPWFGKLSARKNVAQEEKHVVMHSLEAAQVELAYNIRKTAYTIKELEARMAIIKKYMRLEKQNINLFTDYMTTDSMSHTKSIEAELSVSNIEIRGERYKSILKVQKEKLHYLVQKKVKHISNKLRIKKPKSLNYYLAGLRKNPSYHRELALNNVATANKSLTDMQTTPDPYLQLSYVNRTEFPDYATVSVGLPLPLYGTEKIHSEIAYIKTLERKSETLDLKFLIQSQIRENYAKLTETYRIYTIIQNKSLPQLQHMLDLSTSAIEEGADLFTYTNILEQKLALEEERISIMAEFMRTQAKLKALTGVK